MSSITDYRTAVLALLDDAAGTRYTSDQLDQAIRQALTEYSAARPQALTWNVDGNGTRLLEMPADFQPMFVQRVELHDETAQPQAELAFFAYRRDGSWFIELIDCAPAASQSLDITACIPHGIDGLDGAAGTSVPEEDEPVLQIGAAGFAGMARAFSRAENVTLQPDVAGSLLKLANACLEVFRLAIRPAAGAAIGLLPPVPEDSF